MTDARPPAADEATFIAAVRAADPARFALITERHRRELQVHCYRMLANYEDAQDMTQETFLRAWNKRETFKGHAVLRSWLYRIATNACLDFLDKRTDRTPVPSGLADSEVLYLQPYPARMHPEDPQESVVAREPLALAYIVALERNDLAGQTSLLRDDLLFAMLPEAGTLTTSAKDALDGWVSGGLFQPGHDDWRGIPTTVNRMPAAALYLRNPDAPEYRLFAIAVLHVVDGKIAELTGFDATGKPWLDLPPML